MTVPNWRCARHYPEQASMSQWAWEFLRRNLSYHEDFARHGQHQDEPGGSQFAGKWGIRWSPFAPAPDPAESQPVLFWERSANSVRQVRDGDPSVRSKKPSIEFDLTRPLEPQIERTKQLLKRRQKRMIESGLVDPDFVNRRARCEEYRNYLRVLDALRECGFPRDESVPVPTLELIAEEFIESGTPLTTANLRKWIHAARKLRDRDYRLLPTLGK
jgi:hypothetical protein